MFLLSFLLVVVAALTLVLGLFQTGSLLLLWISMTAATAAGLVLLVGLARRRGHTPAVDPQLRATSGPAGD